MQNDFFSMSRFFSVLCLDAKKIRTFTVIVTPIWILFMAMGHNVTIKSEVSGISFFLFLIGYLATGTVMADMIQPLTAQQVLMLPCSTFERWLSRWLISSIGMILLVTFASFIAALLSNVIWHLWLGMPATPMLFIGSGYWSIIGGYILFQCILFFWVIYFRQQQALMLSAATMLGLWLLLVAVPVAGLVFMKWPNLANPERFIDIGFDLSNLMQYIGAPIALYLSYLRLSESEV